MKIAARRVYVVECPTCKQPIDWTGEGAVYFKSEAEAKKNAEAFMSCERMSLTEWCGCRRRKADADRRADEVARGKVADARREVH